ncbi:S-layer protein [Candidatus Micrarchaeota archaeon]|nr:S-layer protein [Candidatus Micrarchaeota archaeon]
MEGKALLVSGSSALDAAIVEAKGFEALSGDRLKILRALASEPKYPAQVARELKMQVQTAYYHIRILQNAGLIRFVETEERGGATAKKFSSAGDAVAVVINASAVRPYSPGRLAKPPHYLEPFISAGHLNGKIVLGSPDPHGKHRARGSELCVAELAMMLGNYANFEYPLYYLDTELRERERKGNIIAVGGPKVNSFMAEINRALPIRFDESSFTLKSSLSGKSYEENAAVVEIVENPFNRTKKILVVAGTNHLTTRVAILALLREREKMERKNSFDAKEWAHAVQGFDEDGDGIMDAVEVLE